MARNRIGLRRNVRGRGGVYYPFTITSVTPASTLAGSGATPLDVIGINFPAAGVVYVNGVAQPTVFVNSGLLQFTLDAPTVAVPGFKSIQVKTALLRSNSYLYPVNFPVPSQSSLSPAFGYIGEGSVVSLSTGTGFYSAGTDATIDGVDAAFSYLTATTGNVTIPSSVIDVAGSKAVAIVNPMPGGGSSAPQTFDGRYRAPTLAALPSAGTPINSGDVDLVLTVTNAYNPASWVGGGTVGTVDGVDVPTVYLSPTSVRITVPAAVTAVAGNKSIRVRNPTAGGGGGNSGAQSYAVGFLVPFIGSIFPTAVSFTAPTVIELLSGTGFYPESVIRIDGVDQPTTYIDSTHLQCPFSPVSVGTVTITVFNPTAGGGGGLSNSKTLAVTAVVSSVSPSVASQYAAGFEETIGGSGFTVSTVGRINGFECVTTFDSSTQIRIQIPSTKLYMAGSNVIDTVDTSGGPASATSQVLTLTAWYPGITPAQSTFWWRLDASEVTISVTGLQIINDKSGNGRTIANSPADNQNPTYNATDAGINGRPSATFDGAIDFIGGTTSPLVADIATVSELTLAGVCRVDTANNNAIMFNNANLIGTNQSPGVRWGVISSNIGGNPRLNFAMYNTGVVLINVGDAITFGAWTYYVVRKVGGVNYIKIGAAAEVSVAAGDILAVTTQRVFAGKNSASNSFYNGRQAEWLGAKTAWTVTEQTYFSNYCADLYNL